MAKKFIKNQAQGQLFSFNSNGNDSYSQAYKKEFSHFYNGYSSRISAMQTVIQKLRENDLKQGYCFLVTDNELSEDQAYYEYPDGKIQIEKIDITNIDVPRTIVKVLNKTETAAVRIKHAILL